MDQPVRSYIFSLRMLFCLFSELYLTGSHHSRNTEDSVARSPTGRSHQASRMPSALSEDDAASSDLPDRVFTSQPLPSRAKMAVPAQSASQPVEYGKVYYYSIMNVLTYQ